MPGLRPTPMRRSALAALTALLAVALPARAQTSPLPPDFDAYVERVREAFGVPGLAVAVVQDGRVVLARGYGTKTMGGADPVTPRTRFGIASNTKAFTATALALLVEEGKVAWDAPVTRYLPDFALSDPYVTANLTVRDLLVHRSGLGLGAGDLLWWPATSYDRAEIVRRLRFVPLTGRFRDGYAYDNVLYSVAGMVIQAVSGLTWERFVQTRLLDPVGMTGSAPTYDPGGDLARTHARVDGALAFVPPDTSANTNPAGGLLSTAEDVAKWMIVQLDSGRVAGGPRLFSAATTRDLWDLVTPIRPGVPPPAFAPLRAEFAGYGLGFFVRDYRGAKLVWHTGGLPGYVSRVSLLPSKKVGVTVLTNAESGEAFEAITYAVLDRALGAPAHDWAGAYARLRAEGDRALAANRSRTTTTRDSTRRPTLPLAAYAGRYEDAWYGDVRVETAGAGLRLRFVPTAALIGALVPWEGDTFLARWDDRTLRADAFVTFTVENGRVTGATMRPASDDVDFSFDFQDLQLVRR